ncbi:glycosyltransferase family 4 protein [Paraglaciecola agarilytica]|uniref:glycosyltransferase family 4 protein n=1 Tax=Paraglaciecola chathamensis TaxID=368405 RepID=UPI001C085D35|nr:glycosyltransferase family 4 protein [Paraglaciecola agarilytica]MBU3016147.1 glycosyltransferase family 4 protein [Paraglaciecola agarilytica]
MKRKVLFYGELPPRIYHGISLSNSRILAVLRTKYSVLEVEDRSGFRGRVYSLALFVFSLIKLVKFSLGTIDLYYTNLPMSFFGLCKTYITIITVKVLSPRTKVITHLHRGDFLTFNSYPKNRFIFKLFRNKIDLILVLSKTSCQEITSNYPDLGDKVTVLHNTVELVNSENRAPSSQMLNDERRFFCLCNYLQSKRIHNLVLLANSEPKFYIDFNGAKSNLEYIEKLNNLNTSSMCLFDDVIGGAEKENKIANAKALLLPSMNEGMPLVILESLSQGTPVICYNIGCISDYLGVDYPGLVLELTDEAFREKMKWIDSISDEEYLKLRVTSFSLFWDNYDPAKLAKSILKTFDSM